MDVQGQDDVRPPPRAIQPGVQDMSEAEVSETDAIDWEDIALEWAACRRALHLTTELTPEERSAFAWLAVFALLGMENAA